MRSYTITLPRGVEVDVFNLPDDFKDIIEKAFSEYTEATAEDYRYCDKLAFIDCLMRNINKCESSYEAVNKLVKERFDYEWNANGNLLTEDDIYSAEFMENCYSAGNNDARLYSHYGLDDHHIYDRIQKVIAKVITIVMNYTEGNNEIDKATSNHRTPQNVAVDCHGNGKTKAYSH